jgi:uncharacterized protein
LGVLQLTSLNVNFGYMSEIEERVPVVLENEGQKIFSVFHKPKNVVNPPCVVVCHGLGGNKIGHYRVYVELAERLVKEGIAVFRFDFRGAGDSEGAFADMTLQGQVSDLLRILEHIFQSDQIDPSRIGLFGRSMGGAVGVMGSSLFDRVKCIALWAPIFNGDQWKHQWDQVLQGSASEKESEEMRRINGQVASLHFYSEMFAINLEGPLHTLQDVPMMIIQGIHDPLVSIAHSEGYERIRRPMDGPFEFIRLEHSDHDFSHPEERIFALEKTTDWFKRYL